MRFSSVVPDRGMRNLGLTIASLGLAICISGLPAFAQQQSGENGTSVEADGPSYHTDADQHGMERSDGYAPDAAGPGGHQDDMYQGPENGRPDDRRADDSGTDRRPDRQRRQNQSRDDRPAYQPAPARLTLPAGTVVSVRTTEWMSSNKSHSGDRFSATLDQPLVANGWVIARRGQILTGRVAVARKADHGNKTSQLGVELSELTLVDGQLTPIRTELVHSSAGRTRNDDGHDVATVATTTGVGAVVGGVAGGGEGAGIGAGIGAAAGIIGVLSTPGKPTVIPPETLLTFRLDVPVTVNTERSQVAFQPVGPSDYARDQDAYAGRRDRQRVVAARPYSSPYLYGDPYYYPGWGYYPGMYFGYSSFYGPGYYGGVRGGYRGGYGRGGFRR